MGELSPLLTCHVAAWVGKRCPPSQCLRQVVDLAPEVIRRRAVSAIHQLPHLGEWPGQHPEGVGVGEPTLRTWKLEKWPCPLLITARDELARAMLESSPCWWGQRRAVGLTNPTTAQTIRTRVICWPTLIATQSVVCWSQVVYGISPVDPGLQNLRDSGLHWDVHKESQWGPSVNDIAETRAANQTSDCLQWMPAWKSRDKGVCCVTHCVTLQFPWQDWFSFSFFLS